MSMDDFASLFDGDASSAGRAGRRLKRGERVEGTVVHIGKESVFLDVGTARDARIERHQLESQGELRVKVGDTVAATVVDVSSPDGAVLSISLGRGEVDVTSLQAAQEGGTAVEGKVTQAVKGGLEVDLSGIRAFCPASQVDLAYVKDLATFVGQELQFRVVEIREGGRSVVVSRRAQLEAERADKAAVLKDKLAVGNDMEGRVISVQKYGALVDLGGLDGLVHISELAHSRTERVEDVVQIGDTVQVRILAIEEGQKGLRIRLSMKALQQRENEPNASKDEILKGTISRHSSFGVFVETPKGEGLVPTRELPLAPGSDPRRAFPVGKELEVAVLSVDPKSGKLRLSATGVSRVQERQHFRDYKSASGGKSKGKGGSGGGLGSLGDLLRDKLGLPEEAPAKETPKATAAPEQSPVQKAAPAAVAAKTPRFEPKPKPQKKRKNVDGVVRRRKG